jgi:2-C-methyl-D-erythritol 4-phosphate cytidylyltransferase
MAIALLLAAGRGERLGFARPKAFVELAGRPLVQWSLDVLAASPAVRQIVVTLPPGTSLPDEVRMPANAVCVAGGAVRSASVRRALRAAEPDDRVVVHDAARPLLEGDLVQRALDTLAAGDLDGAIAAAPVSDTVKRAAGRPPIVSETLERSGLWSIQTPQVFRREALERALDVPEDVLAAATDDAWLIERMGGRIAIVPSHTANLKVTTPVDLELATMLLARRPA